MASELLPLRLPYSLGAPSPPGPESIDLVDLVLTGLAQSSRDGYLKDFDAFARFVDQPTAEAALWGLMRLEQAQVNAIALAWLGDMQRAELAAATIARRLAALKRAVKYARRVGLTNADLEVDRPKAEAFRDCSGPGAPGWRKLLEQAEVDAAAGDRTAVRNLAIVLLLHDRALRRSEVAGLDLPGDLELDRPAIWILGKGRTSKELLTLNPRTVAALRAWIQLRGDAPGPLFTRTDRAARDASRLCDESINRAVGTLAARAGLVRKVRAHGLRHQAITEALDLGWDVRDVKSFSRHRKIDTVLIYDDRRKDVGGEITRSIGGRRKRHPKPG